MASASAIWFSAAATAWESASAVRAPHTAVALVDGAVGLVMAAEGRLAVALAFQTAGERITAIDVIADPERLQEVEVCVLD